jgi:Tfp pilus assembly protein PilN
MIRVNLLEGAADTRAATRATKAAAKTTQQLLMVVGALLLLLAALAGDYWVTSAKLANATEELDEQKRIAEELKLNRERKTVLEKQIRAVKERIKIIDDLQKTQRGPSAMLQLVNSRMPPGNQITLDSISQKGDDLTIQGTARDETVVSDFSRGLELNSGGLFQSVNFQTERVERQVPVDPNDPENVEMRNEVVFNFTLRTKYTPTQVGQPAEGADGAAGAPGSPAAATPPAR